MNEFQAALGLLQLKHIDRLIEKRKLIANQYREILKTIEGISFIEDMPDVKHCYSYFPIFINNKKYRKTRDEIYEELKRYNIYGRRYFYPLISQFPMYHRLESAQTGKMPIAERVTEQVICLPIYPALREEEILRISKLLSNQLK
jgi:dTDP-4-amino-4,6-dideoxygalactose transaminase